MTARSRLPRAIVVQSLRHPRRVLVLWIVASALGGLGLLRLDVETSTDSVLDRADPAWAYYEASRELFGGDEILTLLLAAETPYARGVLADIARITERLESVPGVRRVDSLASVPHVSTGPEGSVSFEPILDAPDLPPEVARARVARDRIAPGALVSASGREFAINVVLEAGAEPYYGEILEQLEQERASAGGFISGVPVFRVESDARVRQQLLTLGPVTVLVMAILLWGIFGSLRAVAIPLLPAAAAVLCLLGGMGAVGVPITITTVTLPSVMLALGCAYAMHFLVAASRAPESQSGRLQFLDVALPVALSGLTTAIGFVAVTFVPIAAVRDIGVFGAIGVLLVLLATLSAVPATLASWPLPRHRRRLASWLSGDCARGLCRVVERRRGAILLAWLVALVAIGVGIQRLEVETDVILWIPVDDPVRSDYEVIRDRLSGISPMNVVVEAQEGDSVLHAEVVSAMAGLADFLSSREEVGKVISLVDPLRQLHEEWSAAPPGSLPEDDASIAQYVLLLESKEYIRDLLSEDHRSANLMLRVDDNGSSALLAVAEDVRRWWDRHGAPTARVQTTGIMFEFARAQSAMTRGQIRGLAFSGVVVAVLLLVALRWPPLALAALVPNAVPVAMAFGAMGLLKIPLDAGTVIVGNLALGIAIDDTVHLAVHYSRARAAGAAAVVAWRETLSDVLPALSYTTLAVAAGFAVLATSDFTPIQNFGIVISGAMLACLAADLLLFPAILTSLRGEPSEQKAY